MNNIKYQCYKLLFNINYLYKFLIFVIDAISLCTKFQNNPDIDIAMAISKWMAQANNRLQKKNKKYM